VKVEFQFDSVKLFIDRSHPVIDLFGVGYSNRVAKFDLGESSPDHCPDEAEDGVQLQTALIRATENDGNCETHANFAARARIAISLRMSMDCCIERLTLAWLWLSVADKTRVMASALAAAARS